jgi:membrane protein
VNDRRHSPGRENQSTGKAEAVKKNAGRVVAAVATLKTLFKDVVKGFSDGGRSAPRSESAGRSAGNSTPRRPPESLWKPRALWGLLKEAGREFVEDKAPRLGAALAYYTAFSLAPLLVIVISIAGLFYRSQGGQEAVQGHLTQQIQNLVGPEGAKAVEAMVANASKPAAGTVASIVGIIMLLVGAGGLFGELQDALNTVWEVQPKPGRGILGALRERFLSFTMVLGSAFLLLVSLVVSAALAALGGMFGSWSTSIIGEAINFVVSFGVVTLLFAMIYRYLPDAKVSWRDVWFGSVVTAALFTLGKLLIGMYLGMAGTASSYGAAGSLAVLLIWLYYSAQIFLFGAELTKTYADRYGKRIEPTPNAEPVTEEARAEQGMPRGRPSPPAR